MTAARFDWHGDKWKFIVIAVSVAVATFLTLWFHIAYKTDAIYPHFFYAPIIMASFWYQKRGMYVALYLSALQLLVHYMSNMQDDITDNLFRASMFIFVSFITATLSERLTKEQAELKESEERFRNLVETTSDWVWEVDKSGVYTYASPAVRYLLGYEPEYVMGKTPFDLMSSGEAKRVAEIFGRLVAERKPVNYLENIKLNKDGRQVILETCAIPFFDPAGIFMGYRGVDRDITERKKAEKELVFQNEEKEKRAAELVIANKELVFQNEEKAHLVSELDIKNSELEQILYAATHDLKTPLVTINGYMGEVKKAIEIIVNLIEKADISSEVRKEITSLTKELPDSFVFISTSISHMDMLLNGLLAFSRSGKVELKIQDIDMNMLISGISDNMKYKLEETGASIEVTDLPQCNGDRKQISMVFSNLIENAFKYLDPERKGEIKVTGHKEGDSSVYCVEDNGIGIPLDHQKQIFHIFHQLDPAKAGEGMGLMIAQRIIERHNGKIWLESEAGKGSRFFVKLSGAKPTSSPS